MLEQDVQLTRLIVERLTELDQRRQGVSTELAETQQRLDSVEELKNKRSAYEDVLERAAALLGRDDLRVEIEVPADDAAKADELRGELGLIDAEQAQYAELIQELQRRAPDLLDAVGNIPAAVHDFFTGTGLAAAPAAPAEHSGNGADHHGSASFESDETESGLDGSDTDFSAAADRTQDAIEQEDAEAEAAETAEESVSSTSMADWLAGVGASAAEDEEPVDEPLHLAASVSVDDDDEDYFIYRAEASAESAPTEAKAAVVEESDEVAEAETGTAVEDELAEPDLVEHELSILPSSAEAAEEALQAAAAEEDDDSHVHWPAAEDSSELPALSIAQVAWDDADIELAPSRHYEALSLEVEPHAVVGERNYGISSSNGNGAHVEEVESEAPQEVFAELATEPETDLQSPSTASFDEAVAGLEAGSLAGDSSFGFAEVHSAAPAFAADDSASFSLNGAHGAVATSVLDEERDNASEENERERLIRLSRFNHGVINGRLDEQAPVFVIDGTAVLERIPHYDRYHLALDESAARDELVRDFSFLARELGSDFYLVFNDAHSPAVETDRRLHLEHGDASSTEHNPGDQRIQELVLDNIENEQQVALVTSDPTLMSLFKGENVLVFSLGEFFLT